MKIVTEKIEFSELKEMAEKMYGNLVKAMVDVRQGIMAVDAPLHSDLLELLAEKEGSEPNDTWGINLYPDAPNDSFVEFDSIDLLRNMFLLQAPAFGRKSVKILRLASEQTSVFFRISASKPVAFAVKIFTQ